MRAGYDRLGRTPPAADRFRTYCVRPGAGGSIADVLAAPCPGTLLFTDDEWQAACDAAGLSPRERQVGRLLLEGRSRKMIASLLRKANGKPLHVGSVDQFIQRLFRKLHVRRLSDVPLRLLAIRGRLLLRAS